MFTKIGMGLATAVLALGLSTTASAETLRYAHVGAEGDLQTRYAAEAAKEIDEATNGNISVQVFPASQLGGVAPRLADLINRKLKINKNVIKFVYFFDICLP